MFTNTSRTYKVEELLCKLFYFSRASMVVTENLVAVSRTEHNIKPTAALQWVSLREEATSWLVF
jgi:hypothetical protein